MLFFFKSDLPVHEQVVSTSSRQHFGSISLVVCTQNRIICVSLEKRLMIFHIKAFGEFHILHVTNVLECVLEYLDRSEKGLEYLHKIDISLL